MPTSQHHTQTHRLIPWLAAIIALLLAGGIQVTHAEECPSLLPDLTTFGALNRPPYAVAYANGMAYMVDHYGLSVYDVRDPASPSLVGELYLPTKVVYHQDIVADGNRIYFTDGPGNLQIVDVSDPTRPEVLGSWHDDAYSLGHLAAAGQRIYAADESGCHLVIFDVSDPATPVVMSVYRCYSESSIFPEIHNVAVSGGFAYITGTGLSNGETPTLQIADVSDPFHPEPAGYLDLDGLQGFGVAVAGDVAYLGVQGAFGSSKKLQLVDVSDPHNPRPLGSTSTDSVAGEVVVQSGTAYLAAGRGGMVTVDVADPGNPSLLGTYTTGDLVLDMAVSHGIAYLAARRAGVQAVAVADPKHLSLLGTTNASGRARGVVLQNGLAYVADGGAGVQIVRVPGLESVGGVDTPGYAYAVDRAGELACVADGDAGLAVVDVSDPANPVLRASLATGGKARGVKVSGHLAYVASGNAGLQIVDVSDPDNPQILHTLHTPGSAYDVDISGSTAYVADDSAGFEIVDITNPSDPQILSRLDQVPAQHYSLADLYATTITVSGQVAYIGHNDYYRSGSGWADGFQVFDVSDPRHPFQTGSLSSPGWVGKVVVSGRIAYVPDTKAGLEILDVEDPANPTLIATAATPWGAFGAAVDPATSTAILADGYVVEAAALPCAHCVGLQATADPQVIVRGGQTAQITVHVRDLAGRPAPGATITGETTIGTLSSFEDNGDGSYTATLASDQRFGTAELTFWLNGVQCSTTLQVTILKFPESPIHPYPGDYTYAVPAVANTPGANGTSWLSDVVLYNGSGTAAQVSLYLIEVDTDSSGAQGRRLTVAPHGAVKIEDVVGTFFERRHTSGLITVGSDRPLVIASRTYNDTPSGTFGQFVAGAPLDETLGRNQTAKLIQLSSNAQYRTNIGFSNPTEYPLTVQVQLFDAGGHQIGTRRYTLEPASFHQANDIFGSDVPDGYAMLWASSTGASYFAYGSVIDNRTGDPIFITPNTGTAYPQQTLFIPAAAHVDGAAGTHWRTDLEIHNTSSHPANCTVELLERDLDNRSPQSRQITVERETSRRLSDVLGTLFGFDGSGSLRIGLSSGAITVSSRTYNQGAQGTFGEFIPSVAGRDAIESGKTAVILHLAESASSGSGYRSNVGVVNTSGEELTLTIQLFDGDGASLGTVDIGVPPFGFRQVDRIIHRVNRSDQPNCYALLRTDTPGGAFFAYGSVIDNRSGDAIYVPAVEVPE